MKTEKEGDNIRSWIQAEVMKNDVLMKNKHKKKDAMIFRCKNDKKGC